MVTRIFQVRGEVRQKLFIISVDCPLCGGECEEAFLQNFEVINDSRDIWELKSLDDSVHDCKKTGEKFFMTTALVQGDYVHYINCQIVSERSL